MSKNLLLILTAGVDIWAALYIIQIHQPRTWDVSIAITDNAAPASLSTDTMVQIWLRKDGTMSVWPEKDCLSIEQIEGRLADTFRGRDTDRAIRLMCDPELKISDWAATASRLSRQADQLRIGPAPP